MISLEKLSGLPIEMKDDFSLVFGKPLTQVKTEIREFSSMRNYLKDPSSSYWRKDIYRSYTNLALPEHEDLLKQAGLEYVITVIPPGKINDEFVKTRGYYQPAKKGTEFYHPGVYEVLYGNVFWLLQSASRDHERLSSADLASATRGEKLLIPPGFGIVTINPTDDAVVVGNWHISGTKGVHEPYEIHNGAAYYVCESQRLTASGSTTKDIDYLPNLSYKLVPELKKVSVREQPKFDLRAAWPLYFTGTKNIQSLDFLLNPEKYDEDLIPDKLFRA